MWAKPQHKIYQEHPNQSLNFSLPFNHLLSDIPHFVPLLSNSPFYPPLLTLKCTSLNCFLSLIHSLLSSNFLLPVHARPFTCHLLSIVNSQFSPTDSFTKGSWICHSIKALVVGGVIDDISIICLVDWWMGIFHEYQYWTWYYINTSFVTLYHIFMRYELNCITLHVDYLTERHWFICW